MTSILRALAATCIFAAALPGQQDETGILVMFRVTSVQPRGRLVIDRGETDKLEEGDTLVVLPRNGGRLSGRVTRVEARTAVVELDDVNSAPPVGTRGEVWLPKLRFARTTDPDRARTKTEDSLPTEPRPPAEWQNTDEEWKPGMPLLTRVRPVRPENRTWSMTGRAFLSSQLSHVPRSGSSNSWFRSGADVTFQNPFHNGGDLRVDGELNYKTSYSEDRAPDLLVRRAAYTLGGTRYARDRFDFGRFMQHDLSEFGVMDGVAWSRRRENGHRFGASLGFLPEPNDDFRSFKDFQLSAHYQWVADEYERVSLTGGFQKTFHYGKSDRDLLLARFSVTPEEGWEFYGTTWIDLYTGNDSAKKHFIELTQALLVAARRYDDGSGLDISLWHQMFPDVLANVKRYMPPNRVASDRHDRLTINAWLPRGEDTMVRGTAALWNDEDESGGSLEFGIDQQRLFFENGSTGVVLYAADAAFESAFGALVRTGRRTETARWEVSYDFGYHHRVGFPSDFADIIQHRIFGEYEMPMDGGWDLRGWADSNLYDGDVSVAVGFWVQKRF